jgi:hypothetical protein
MQPLGSKDMTLKGKKPNQKKVRKKTDGGEIKTVEAQQSV